MQREHIWGGWGRNQEVCQVWRTVPKRCVHDTCLTHFHVEFWSGETKFQMVRFFILAYGELANLDEEKHTSVFH